MCPALIDVELLTSDEKQVARQPNQPTQPTQPTRPLCSRHLSPVNDGFHPTPDSVHTHNLLSHAKSHQQLTAHHSPIAKTTTTHGSLPLSLLLATPNSPLTTHHSPLTTHHSPLTTHHSSLTTHRSPPATRHSPLATCHSLFYCYI